jgi:ferredoxin
VIVKVRVLHHVCVGHGMCILACPELFRLSDEDGHAILLTEHVPFRLEDAIMRAVAGCPEGAIEADGPYSEAPNG